MKFQNISPFELNYNFFSGLHKDWSLLCAGDANNIKKCNMMTISWGGIGILWNKPVAICYIRPQRYTLKLIKKNNFFSLNFFSSNSDINLNYKEILNFCGNKSGADLNKFTETNLNLYKTPGNNPAILQANLIIDCKVLYSDLLKENLFLEQSLSEKFYPKKDFHEFFIGEIVNVLQSVE